MMKKFFDDYRVRIRALSALIITCTAIVSFSSVQHLAQIAGFGTLSWLFPICTDAVAAFGLEIWMRKTQAHLEAMWLSIAAITASLVANVIEHWLSTRSVLAAVLGAVPPVMLGGSMFVLHRHHEQQREQNETDRNNGNNRSSGIASPISPVNPGNTSLSNNHADHDKISWLAQLEQQHDQEDLQVAETASLSNVDMSDVPELPNPDEPSWKTAARQRRQQRPRTRKARGASMNFDDAVRGPDTSGPVHDPLNGTV